MDTIETNPDKGLEMVDKGMQEARALGWKKGIVFAMYMKGKGYEYKKDLKGAIKYYKEALDYSTSNKMAGPTVSGLADVGRLYGQTGMPAKGLDYYYMALNLSQLQKDTATMAGLYQAISHLFYDMRDYDRSEYNSNKSLQLGLASHNKSAAVAAINAIAVLRIEHKKYDEALAYLQKCERIIEEEGIEDPVTAADIYNDLGLCYDYKGIKDSALYYYMKSISVQRDLAYNPNRTTQLDNIGQLLMDMNRDKEAEHYLKAALAAAKEISYNTEIVYAAGNLATLYEKAGNTREAYKYEKIAMAAKDSAMNKEKLKGMEEVEARYKNKEIAARNEVLQKENDLQHLKLRQSRLLLYGSAGGVLLFILIAGLLFRQNGLLRSQQRIELAHKQLYAQMNPHFIFNCLSSIQHFILENDIDNANEYLTNFASLMRQTLENSKSATITLREELTYLQSYLAMEHLRFENKFTYSVDHDEDIDIDFVELPPMMVQPFAENAIKHGLAHFKHNEGRLHIHFYKKDGALCCEIDDNGIGREQSQELRKKINPGYSSHGMAVTKERMELVSKINKADHDITIIDKLEQSRAAGTRVIIKFPVEV